MNRLEKIIQSRQLQDQVLVYRCVHTATEMCSLGDIHAVEYWTTKKLTLVDTHVFDTGYYRVRLGVYVDAQSRLYLQGEFFDTGRKFYTRATDTVLFENAVRPRSGAVARKLSVW